LLAAPQPNVTWSKALVRWNEYGLGLFLHAKPEGRPSHFKKPADI